MRLGARIHAHMYMYVLVLQRYLSHSHKFFSQQVFSVEYTLR